MDRRTRPTSSKKKQEKMILFYHDILREICNAVLRISFNEVPHVVIFNGISDKPLCSVMYSSREEYKYKVFYPYPTRPGEQNKKYIRDNEHLHEWLRENGKLLKEK